MNNRDSLEIKKQILLTLKDGNGYTYAQLEKKIGSNWQSIRAHCRELEIFNSITIEKKKSHKKNNKPYSELRITDNGLDVLKKLD